MPTLYSQVFEDILKKIQDGELKVGQRLPPEEEYAARLGVSRSTLRLALAELESFGVISRKKRSGTAIISKEPKKRFVIKTGGIEEILSIGRENQQKVHQTRLVRATDIPVLADLSDPGDKWLEALGVGIVPGEDTPFCVTRTYVPENFALIASTLTESQESIFSIIEKTFDVSVARVTQNVTAVACNARSAELLGLPINAPVLRTETNVYGDGDQLLEVSVAILDPLRFQVRSDVKVG